MIKIELKHLVNKEDNKTTVTHILKDRLNISSRLLIKLKMNEKILVNGIPVFSNYVVSTGDNILVKIDFEETDYITPEEMNLNILYEDEYILAVNKPAGIVVHPSSNHLNGTLANGVKHYLNNSKKIRPINRLDRDTSGIVLFAKNEYIQELMITTTKIKKEYIAITDGILLEKFGVIDLPIARKTGSIMLREVSEEGQKAVTYYEVIKEIQEKYSLIKLELGTGRTHQIRVHLSFLEAPILGDTLYGKQTNLIARQALHAYKLSFIHPITQEKIEISSQMPKDILKLLN